MNEELIITFERKIEKSVEEMKRRRRKVEGKWNDGKHKLSNTKTFNN